MDPCGNPTSTTHASNPSGLSGFRTRPGKDAWADRSGEIRERKMVAQRQPHHVGCWSRCHCCHCESLESSTYRLPILILFSDRSRCCRIEDQLLKSAVAFAHHSVTQFPKISALLSLTTDTYTNQTQLTMYNTELNSFFKTTIF